MWNNKQHCKVQTLLGLGSGDPWLTGTRKWSSILDCSVIAQELCSTPWLKIPYINCRYDKVTITLLAYKFNAHQQSSHFLTVCVSPIESVHNTKGAHGGVVCLDKQLTHDCTSLLMHLPHTHAITLTAHQSIPQSLYYQHAHYSLWPCFNSQNCGIR